MGKSDRFEMCCGQCLSALFVRKEDECGLREKSLARDCLHSRSVVVQELQSCSSDGPNGDLMAKLLFIAARDLFSVRQMYTYCAST